MTELRKFQLEFGRYVRDPAAQSLPEHIPPRRARVYEELLFNNISGFINACFPVCRSLCSAEQWLGLRRDFFRDWRAQSPYFSQIPAEFLAFLEQNEALLERLPPWFLALAHYEWVELDLDVRKADNAVVPLQDTRDPKALRLNPVLHNLAYEWPVHKIRPDALPEAPQATFLVALRNAEHQVRFIEVNPATSMLINLLQEQELPQEHVPEAMAGLLQRPCDEAFAGFCQQVIEQLITQEVIIDPCSEQGA